MATRKPRSQPTWKDVKARLTAFDEIGLLNLIHDLYEAHKDNRTFLHTRLNLGEDTLEVFKETICRWLWPDFMSKQDVSVSKAKQAISNYRKAANDPAGLAELMVYFCECAAGYAADVGEDDEAYLNALVLTFESALEISAGLPGSLHKLMVARLDCVRKTSHKLGYFIGDHMDSLLFPFEQELNEAGQ
jgi:hypothetical protein